MSRRVNDFYETAPWQTRALLSHQVIAGTVFEPCCGDGSITRELQKAGLTVITNDIDPTKEADFHMSADDPLLYHYVREQYGPIEWVVTNPPYEMPLCTNIVAQAVEHAETGVAMNLRISFREPTARINPRGPWLKAHPIARLLTMPRYSYTGNGKSDSVTTEWVIWFPKKPALGNILSLYNADVDYA